MNNNNGFTLIELLIATVIILIVSVGFFSWSGTVIYTNLSAQKNNTAYAMARDVAERIQKMPDNVLNQTKTGNQKYIGYTSGGDMRQCSAGVITANPVTDTNGRPLFTNPWKGTSPQTLYLYDKNNCEGLTWTDAACGSSGLSIDVSANSGIDHPNTTGSLYNVINPIRSYHNTTFYAVWSVAYIPCNAGPDTSKRKIFVTVYWIDPEPTDTTLNDVVTKINNGTYTLKSVSVIVDKAVGAN